MLRRSALCCPSASSCRLIFRVSAATALALLSIATPSPSPFYIAGRRLRSTLAQHQGLGLGVAHLLVLRLSGLCIHDIITIASASATSPTRSSTHDSLTRLQASAEPQILKQNKYLIDRGAIQSSIMAGLFKRVYDWLLRLFWSVAIVAISRANAVPLYDNRSAHLATFRCHHDTDDFVDRATEMDITMIGLQNAGKTSLLRVLAVRTHSCANIHPWLTSQSRAENSPSSMSSLVRPFLDPLSSRRLIKTTR